jgi:hypothetical protein
MLRPKMMVFLALAMEKESSFPSAFQRIAGRTCWRHPASDQQVMENGDEHKIAATVIESS